MREREKKLWGALKPVFDAYDYIIIDPKPNLGLLVVNAMVAATEVMIPLQADFLAQPGVTQCLTTVYDVIHGEETGSHSGLNPQLRISGVLLTMTNDRTRHSREVIEEAHHLQDSADEITPGLAVPVYTATIRYSTVVKDACRAFLPVSEYEPNAPAAQDYRDFLTEFLAQEDTPHAAAAVS